jgi:uncharacterized protein (UPF0276 family)
MLKIATPISHLFKDSFFAQEISNYSDVLEFRDHSINYEQHLQEVFHCELQPIHKMDEKDFEYLQKVKDEKKALRLISFHIASCYDKPIIKDSVYQPGGRVYSIEEMLNFAKNNFIKIKSIFGNEVNLAIENNNYYPTEAYKFITNPDFIKTIVEENDIHFLFDIAHAKVSAHNYSISYKDYVNGLPLNKCIQLHICRYGINKVTGSAFDAHYPPTFEDLQEVFYYIKNHTTIKYLTIEYYKDPTLLVELLKELKKKLYELS